MIRAIIVEDEQPAARRLADFLEKIPDVQVLEIVDSGQAAAGLIERLQPEAVFLDIHLSDMSGIDMLPLLEHRPAVIFTTAYDEYAVQAFRLNAVDYLLKPYSEERLAEAVERLRERLKSENPADQIKELLKTWQPQQSYLRRIPSKVGDKIYILSDDEVVYFAVENKLVFAHLVNKKYIINYTLEELQARLDPEKFFRIHRSTIVNLNYVQAIESWFGGGYKMTVRDQKRSELVISRAAGRELRQKLGW